MKIKKNKLRKIPNPVQLQGFSVQRITLPDFVESHRSWLREKGLVGKVHKNYLKTRRRAILIGIVVGLLATALPLLTLWSIGHV